MTAPSIPSPPTCLEPIPGYRLKQLIGSGGYGEVWSAEAPGGLTKAVKIAHAHLDEKQAAVELQSLNRIKQVRHPFLLSLERIEWIDDRLVIVSELADGSLKQRYQRTRDAGMAGIPRDELLGHLKDAAEALDYIREYYSLQHLDIKPENLLLIGGRIKLADFGLVSEIDAAADALVNGLTPLYASPEVFDGRPGSSSDQYSLAVLYCEMLTGVLPFDGKSTAQLAAQHLEGHPNLEALPAADRPLVLRALSKDPTQRFPSCREFIDRLSWIATQSPLTPSTATSSTQVAPASSGWPPLEAPLVQVESQSIAGVALDTSSSPPPDLHTMAISQVRMDWKGTPSAHGDDSPASIIDLLADGQEPAAAAFRPTLLIGLGGSGARVLHALRRHLDRRYGGVSRLPALGMLLIDTSSAEVCQSLGRGGQALFESRQILITPLRPAGGYAKCAVGKTRSVARRWIYNVPRRLQTEGFRPLGRLALIDSLDKVIVKVRGCLHEIMATEAVAVTASQVGLAPGSTAPRVFLIGSTSGGVGSGMLLEAGYTVRNVLSRMGLSQPEVNAVLCFATSRNSTDRDLGLANTIALLRELRHFSHPDHQFPGEPESGLPPAARGQGPFDDAYFAFLGDYINEETYQNEIINVAEYLFRSMLTESARWLDHWRQSRHAGCTDRQPRLASFRVARLKAVEGEVVAAVSEWACQALLGRWCGAPSLAADTKDPLEVVRLDADRRAQCEASVALELECRGVSLKAMIAKLQTTLMTAMNRDPDDFLRRALEETLNVGAVCQATLPEILDALDVILGARGEQTITTARHSLYAALRRDLQSLQQHILTDIMDWLLNLLDTAPGRIAETLHSIHAAQQYLNSLERAATACLTEPVAELKLCEAALRSAANVVWIKRANTSRGVAQLSIEPRLGHFFRLRLDELLLRDLTRLLASLQGPLNSLTTALRELQAELSQASDSFATANAEAAAPDDPARPSAISIVRDYLGGQPDEFLAQIELHLEHDFLGGPAPLKRLLTQPPDRRRQLNFALRQAAVSVASRACVQAESRDVSLSDALPSAERAARERWHEVLLPQALTTGGARRVLIVKPERDPEPVLPDDLSKYLGVPPTIVDDTESETTICCEAEQIDPARLAQMLTKNRREFNELAARLASRADIDWSELA